MTSTKALGLPTRFLLGEAYRKGAGGVPMAPDRARRYYRMGCDGGDPLGCYAYAVALDEGVGGEKDRERAKVLMNVLCDAGLPEACRDLKR